MSPSLKKTVAGIGGFLLLALSVPFLTFVAQNAQKILVRATLTPANIVVDAAKVTTNFPDSWRAFSQGGEESTPYTLTPVVAEIAELSPRYIRVDHIYDFYDVVKRNSDGSLDFSFITLDVLVKDILATGAKPFLSLSYMPPVMAKDSNITSYPLNWDEWKLLVQKTIEHYSGKDNLNLEEVYYEVWNEPDLFGRFQIGRGEKDYLTLYTYAAHGALNAQNANKFYFGGPATTGAYPAWFTTLISYTERNNLPLDFISWHYYGTDLSKFAKDIDVVDQVLANYPDKTIQKIVSEWGIDSENNPAYDNALSASYTVAGIKAIGERLNLAFIFEIKDGKSPQGQALWGRWGLITHESFGKAPKPRFEVLKMILQMHPRQLEVKGGGTFVDALATFEGNTIKLLLYNYDLSGSHYEAVPITFKNLSNGIYTINTSSLLSQTPTTQNQTVSDGSFATNIVLTPNNIALVEVKKISDNVLFTQGRQPDTNDQSIELTQMGELPTFSINVDQQSGPLTLNFWYKPYWSGNDDNTNHALFNLAGAGGQTLFAKAEKVGFTNSLIFGLVVAGKVQEDSQVTIPIRDWVINTWHNLNFSYNENKLILEIDGVKEEKDLNIVLLPLNQLELQLAQGAIDDLVLRRGETILLNKSFNGSLD